MARLDPGGDIKKSDCCDAGVWMWIALRVDPPSSQSDLVLLPVEMAKTNLIHLRYIESSRNAAGIDSGSSSPIGRGNWFSRKKMHPAWVRSTVLVCGGVSWLELERRDNPHQGLFLRDEAYPPAIFNLTTAMMMMKDCCWWCKSVSSKAKTETQLLSQDHSELFSSHLNFSS